MTTHSLVPLSDSEAIRLTPNGMHSGMDVTIQNVHESATVYIGGEGVTATDYGYALSASSAISFELPPKDALYAISSIDGSEIAVLKMGLED